jgi:hypothetical protein
MYVDDNMILSSDRLIKQDDWADAYADRHLVSGQVTVVNEGHQGWSIGKGPDE